MTRIAMVGPGGVGSYFAAHLIGAGHDVISCARRPFDEYVIESEEGPIRAAATVVTDPGQLGESPPVDWALVAVKAHQTEAAAGWFAPLIGPETVVISVQNGVEGVARLTPLVDGAVVWPSVVYCGGELVSPGVVRHHGGGTLIVPDDPRAKELIDLFDGTPCDIRVSSNWITHAWRKLGMNVIANGITALTRRRIDVLTDPGIPELASTLLTECWAVGRMEGAELTDVDVEKYVANIKPPRGDGGTSMYYDRLAGRPTEHDAIYGAVIRAAERHGIEVPATRAVQALIVAGDPA